MGGDGIRLRWGVVGCVVMREGEWGIVCFDVTDNVLALMTGFGGMAATRLW